MKPDRQAGRPSTPAGKTPRSSNRKSSRADGADVDEPECDSSSSAVVPTRGKRKSSKNAKRSSRQKEDGARQLASVLRNESDKLSEQLLVASEKGNKHAVYLLLHQGVDKDRCKGLRGYSPLHHAATRGHLEVLQLLLDFGWRVNICNDSLETPLHLACYDGHVSVVEFLLDRGADVNAQTSDQETPLFYATRKSQYRVVRLLMRRECDLAVKNHYGDVAEDEATDETTLAEFAAGKEDFRRLSGEGSSQTRALHGVGEQVLPQRLRERVLSFLDLKSLGLASQVSYRWHRAADSPSLWRKLGVSRWGLLLNATMGIGVVPRMAMLNTAGGGFCLNLSKNSSRRPASCDEASVNRFMPLSVTRKGRPMHREEQRPQTASLACV